VTTSAGVVVIDTPQLPTKAVAMRQEAESHGPIRYLINTENHVDHIFRQPLVPRRRRGREPQGLWGHLHGPEGGARPVRVRARGGPDRRPRGRGDPPDRDDYYANLPRGTVVFTGDLTLKVGDHTIHCLWTPGHTPGQLAVHVPEERVVFTGDTIFSGCQTWLMTSNVDQWLEALERIARYPTWTTWCPGTGRS
jgi:cyclase